MKNNLIKGIFIAGLALTAPLTLVGCKDKEPTISGYTFSDYDDSYYTNETFSILGTKLNLKMSDGTTKIVDVTAEMIKQLPDISTAGTKTITVTYNSKEYTYTINVEQYVPTVSLVKVNNLKTDYFIGDNLQIGSATLTITTDGVESNVEITNDMVKNFNTTTAGTKDLSIVYKNKTLNVKYTVTAVAMAEITNVTGITTTYFVGDNIVISEDAKLTYRNNNGTTNEIKLVDDMISGFDTTSAGNKTLTVTYGGKTFDVNYTVTAVEVAELVSIEGLKVDYFVGDTIDLSNAKLNYKNNNNSTANIEITNAMISGFDTTSAGDNKTLTIIYSGKNITFTYNVKEPQLLSITIHTNIELNYNSSNTQFDVANGKITATYENKSETVNIEASMLSNFDNSVGTHTATITFNGKTTTFEYTVTQVQPQTQTVTATKAELEMIIESESNGEIELSDDSLCINYVNFNLNGKAYQFDIESLSGLTEVDLSDEDISFDLEELIIESLGFCVDGELITNNDYEILNDDLQSVESVTFTKENNANITITNDDGYYVQDTLSFEINVYDKINEGEDLITIMFNLKIFFDVT